MKKSISGFAAVAFSLLSVASAFGAQWQATAGAQSEDKGPSTNQVVGSSEGREFELRRPHIVRNALILVILILCVFRDAESTRECSGVHGTSITIPLETRMNTG